MQISVSPCTPQMLALGAEISGSIIIFLSLFVVLTFLLLRVSKSNPYLQTTTCPLQPLKDTVKRLFNPKTYLMEC